MLRMGRSQCCRRNLLVIKRKMSMVKRILEMNRMQISNSDSSHSIFASSGDGQPIGGKLQKVRRIETEPSSSIHWPRKIFSGIQPTGTLHLGNYLGAVRKWLDLQRSNEHMTICIVDMHSITLPHNPPILRENIFNMAATLLACGIDPAKSTIFVQSAVMEHCEFNWILSSLTTMPRLAQLPQFKEKSKQVRDVPLGLYVYPVLQAADIMLYKATHVPVGADQVQHIQLAQHLARNFNTRYGEMFPICNPLIDENDGSRILSLRDGTKKMSKSDTNVKGTIHLSDSADQIRDKIKKALTDFTSDISFNPHTRPGVSNLINILALVSDKSIKQVVEEANTLDTARFKDRVSEAVIEHLRPIREKIDVHLANRSELSYMLEMGAERARKTAEHTMSDVKQRLGLGTYTNVPASVHVAPLLPEHSKITASQRLSKSAIVNPHVQAQHDQRHEHGYSSTATSAGGNAGEPVASQQEQSQLPPQRPVYRPMVPTQSLRVEKSPRLSTPRHVFKMDSFNAPKMGFTMTDIRNQYSEHRGRHRPPSTGLGFGHHPLDTVNSISGFKYGQNSKPGAVASVTSQVSARDKNQDVVLANSSFYKAAASSFNNINASVVNVAAKSVRSIKQKAIASGNELIDVNEHVEEQETEQTVNENTERDGEEDTDTMAKLEESKLEN